VLYRIVKFSCRLILPIFYRKLFISSKTLAAIDGPILLVANHPNSFFDALLLGTIFKLPIHSLTRADMFTKKWLQPLLKAMNLIPIYRIRDGVAALQKNNETFEVCNTVFKKNGAILIFGEAKCEGQYELLPLQKGAVKLAIQAWLQNNLQLNKLKIVPVAISYSNLKGWRKIGSLVIGNPIEKPATLSIEDNLPLFTNNLRNQLNNFFQEHLIQWPAIQPHQKKQWEALFQANQNANNTDTFNKQVNQAITNKENIASNNEWPIIFLKALYFPISFFLHVIISAINKKNVHYDSLLLSFLIVLMPLWWFFVATILFLLLSWPFAIAVFIFYVLLPFFYSKPFVYSNKLAKNT
jgi:1-acyl-sn-glycerol-3-phosphate acyltransferase